ncbi:energy transducer TonB [Oceanihabitans sp.]|nr:energy transducer TonB [Oceanihabitans sp.]
MKKIVFLICILSVTLLQAQEKKAKENNELEINVIDESSEPEEVPFAIIENVPVYPGCDKNMSSQALKECMSSQISSVISKNFNTKLANSLDLPAGKTRIMVMFKIDEKGEVVDIKARAPHPKLEEEAVRVINLLPKMDSPGYFKDKAVTVPYSLPIMFVIEEPKPLSNKEQRRLKKENR